MPDKMYTLPDNYTIVKDESHSQTVIKRNFYLEMHEHQVANELTETYEKLIREGFRVDTIAMNDNSFIIVFGSY